MQVAQKKNLNALLVVILSVMCTHICHSEVPSENKLPPLDERGENMLAQSRYPFFDVLHTFKAKVACDKRYFVYVDKLFVDRWQDLFTPHLACTTQNEPKQVTKQERQVYMNVHNVFGDADIMRLFCKAAVQWLSGQVQSDQQQLPQEALLGQYVANMPFVLKKELFCVQMERALWSTDEGGAYFDRSRYAFCALLANTLSFKAMLELFDSLDERKKKLEWYDGSCGFTKEEQIAKLEQLQHFLYQALGEGQRYKIALYCDLKRRCDELQQRIITPVELQASFSTGARYYEPKPLDCSTDNSWRNRFTPQNEQAFFAPTVQACVLARESKRGKATTMSYQKFLKSLCPDVLESLQQNSTVCDSFFKENTRRCAEAMGLSPRKAPIRPLRASGQFLTVPQGVHFYDELERIFDTKVQVAADIQRALCTPHLHETPLNTEQLRAQWPQELDRILRLRKQYADNDLVAVDCAEKAHKIALRLLCDAERVPNDIEGLLYRFMFPQWGLWVKPCPANPDSVYIISDGIRDLLCDQSQISGTAEQIPTCERMQPNDVFRLFSSHYAPAHQRSAIVVPQKVME